MPYSVEQFSSIPAKEQTLELCEEAVLRDWKNIKYVSKRFLSQELCLKAMEQNAHACLYIKKEALTAEIIVAFFKQVGEFGERSRQYAFELFKKFEMRLAKFKNFKLEDVLDKESAIKMVKAYGNSFLLLPPVYLKDRDVVLASLETFGQAIEHIPPEEQTKEMALKAVKGGVNRTWLNYEFYKDDEVIDTMIANQPTSYHYLDRDEITYERCLLAVRNGLSFNYVDKEYYTQEVFDALMINGKVRLKDVPTEFLTKELLKLFLENTPVPSSDMEDLSPDVMDEELAYLAVCKGCTLELTPCIREHQSKRVIKEALSRIWTDIKHVKPEFITKELAQWLIKQRPESIEAFPKEVLSEELCYFAVTKGVDLSCFDASFQSQRMINKILQSGLLKCERITEGNVGSIITRVTNDESKRRVDTIRSDFKTPAFYLEVLKQNSNLLTHVPTDVLTDDVLVPLVQHNWRYIQYIPKECQTANVAMVALEQSPEAINYLEL